MSDEQSGIPNKLREKFPHLQPVKRKPVLATVNGIGFSMFGNRDFDSDTRTYVKTHCFCLIFVPLIAIGAYRVADAERGWYFLGKERLSSFARSWNIGFLGLSLMFAAILAEHSYKSSPEYRARQDLQDAAGALHAGKPLLAARRYQTVAEGQWHTEEGLQGLHDALEQSLSSDDAATVAAGFRFLNDLPSRFKSPTPILPDAAARGMTLVEKFRPKNPEGALEIFHPVSALQPGTNNAARPLEIALLKETIAANPTNMNRVVELALIYEQQEQRQLESNPTVSRARDVVPESVKLLTPYQDKLGATEGARILGEHLLHESKYEEAYALLYPYVQTNQNKLHALEREYTNAVSVAYRNAVDQLKHNRAEPSFYAKYQRASKLEKDQMVEEYVARSIQTDPGLQRAERNLTAGNKIVNVTLDLGMVQLNRAQRLSDSARKQELEAAEKTLLSVQGVAGSSDAYRMHLGQVYYWLGKSKEGKELFDQLLAAHHGQFPVLMAIAETLRGVGEAREARQLFEEGYKAGKNDEERFHAAGLRARTFVDTDDEIAWLKKCDSASPSVQVDLNTAQGSKALEDQNRDLATQFYRKAIAGYDGLPRNAVSLNNCGLVYLELFHATGRVEDYNRGLTMFEQAVALTPGDSMVLNNFANLLVTRAYMDAVGDEIHFEALKESPDFDMLRNLYTDEAGWKKVYQRLQGSEYMKKTLNYLDKALLLMPKNRSLYQFSLHLRTFSRDLAELQKLQQRLETASPDMAGAMREIKEAYAAEKDKERLDRCQKEIRRFEQVLATDAVKGHALTLATAENKITELSLYTQMYGGQVNPQDLVARAQTNYQRQPSAASRSALVSALFFCAQEDLKKQNADYLRQAQLTQRSLWPMDVVIFVAAHNPTVATLVQTNANVLKAAELLKEEFRLMPRHRTISEWSLFRLLDSQLAGEILARCKQDQAGRLVDQLQWRLNPGSAAYVLEQYWTSRMNGDEAGANDLYARAVKEGVPLPAM